MSHPVTFWLKNDVAAGSNFLSLQKAGSAPSNATTATGWTVGTTAPDNWSLMEAGVERAAATFGGTELPNAAPNNTLGDCFRSENTLNGLFAAEDWTLSAAVIAVTSGGDQDPWLYGRLWKGTDPTGANAVEIFDFGGVGFALNVATNLTTVTPQASGSLISNSVQVTFADEYLFLQIACRIFGAGGAADRDCLMRVGSDSWILGPEFTEPLPTAISPIYQAQQISRRYVPVGY